MSLARYYYTAKYLKPIQFTNRLTRRIRKPRRYQGNALTPVEHKLPWQFTATVSASFQSGGMACFLNEAGPLFEWENPRKSKLWLYNLHYFDDLVAEGAKDHATLHREVIARWIEDNPPHSGTGWDPYPLSLRLCNWIKWLLADNSPVDGMHKSLVEQAHALSQQVEHHLLGNHILANAKALVFAGTYFDGEIADQWLTAGLTILKEQLDEQVLEDGAHFELSPMYHSIVLMDVLDLIQLGLCYPGSEISRMISTLRVKASAMANWLEGVSHPDGDIPFFNDAAFGIAPSPAAILRYARSLGVVRPVVDEVLHHYDASGYVAVHLAEQFAVLDVACIGPDYLPGHAHADTLSFEWSLRGQRVIVNSGTSLYGLSEERLRQRQTAAHNTVVVNDADSSEVWSGFRVARRARPFDVTARQTSDGVVVQAAHDGYRRLRLAVTHRREWQVTPGLFRVVDRLTDTFKTAVACFHLHPAVSACMEGEAVALRLADGSRCTMTVDSGEVALTAGTWHPQFGLSESNQCIAVRFTGPELRTSFRY